MPHDANGFSFSPADQWTDQISWAPYQTVGGAQDFQTYQGHTYRQASKSGAGVQTTQNAHQEFEDFALQAVAAQHGSNHNSPAFSAAEVASLHSEVSLETAHSSNFFSNVSNNCSPSIPDMDCAYDAFGEYNMDGAYPTYPMSTGADSPAAFSTAMSRGNSTMSNIQFHHSPT